MPLTKDWITQKAETRETEKYGRGLFAVQPIQTGEEVLIWGGEYTDSKGAKDAEVQGKLVIQWDENLYSVEDRGNDAGYFINHACDSNTWMKDAYTLIARRAIRINEEITVDYGLWEADPNYVSKWRCMCGTSICRGIITGNDWKIEKVQEMYLGHFSPLINKKILGRIKGK